MSVSPPLNAPDIDTLNDAREHARRQRATWLQLLVNGQVDVIDLTLFAQTPDGAALRSLKLKDILEACPGWGRVRVRGALQRLLATQDCHRRWDQVRLSWLLDRRASTSRMTEWHAQASGACLSGLWPGFPYTPPPEGAQ